MQVIADWSGHSKNRKIRRAKYAVISHARSGRIFPKYAGQNTLGHEKIRANAACIRAYAGCIRSNAACMQAACSLHAGCMQAACIRSLNRALDEVKAPHKMLYFANSRESGAFRPAFTVQVQKL